MSGGPCFMSTKVGRSIIGINSGGQNDKQNEATRISTKIIEMFKFTKQILGKPGSQVLQPPQKKQKVTNKSTYTKRKDNVGFFGSCCVT